MYSFNNLHNNIDDNIRPQRINDIARDRNLSIHNKLYNVALERLMKDIMNYENVRNLFDESLIESEDFDIKDHILNITEHKNITYWKPSNVTIVFKTYVNDRPKFKKLSFSLADYWQSGYTDYERSAKNVMFDKNVENDLEIIKFDYIRGKATVHSKFNDITYEVDFDDLNEHDKRSIEINLPSDLFIKQINF